MGAIGRLVNFAAGGIAGTAVGMAVAAFWSPRTGEENQNLIFARIEEAKTARRAAEVATDAKLREKFRQAVDDPNALRSE